MKNIILAWENFTDDIGTGVFGGSWPSPLPLTNILDPALAVVARSGSLSLSTTQFKVGLQEQQFVNLIGVLSHSLSVNASIKVTASKNTSMTPLLYDSGWVPAIPEVWGESGGGLWGLDSVWTGKYLETDLEGLSRNTFFLPPSGIVPRFVRVEMDDQTNAAGYVDIGRIFIGPSWESSYNFDVGAQLGWRDLSVIDEGLDGTNFSETKAKKRFFNFGISFLGKNEVFSQAFEIQRRQGTTKQVVVIPSPEDPVHQFRESFIGRFKTLSAIQMRQAALNDIKFQIEEVL